MGSRFKFATFAEEQGKVESTNFPEWAYETQSPLSLEPFVKDIPKLHDHKEADCIQRIYVGNTGLILEVREVGEKHDVSFEFKPYGSDRIFSRIGDNVPLERSLLALFGTAFYSFATTGYNELIKEGRIPLIETLYHGYDPYRERSQRPQNRNTDHDLKFLLFFQEFRVCFLKEKRVYTDYSNPSKIKIDFARVINEPELLQDSIAHDMYIDIMAQCKDIILINPRYEDVRDVDLSRFYSSQKKPTHILYNDR